MRELATIEAYYNDNAEAAQQLLDSTLAIPGLTDMEKAEVKMLLADILVLENDIWQASLYYMQIDTDFKFETIGSEAKYKNARVFYYDGDFQFAQSQLDVLKQSTSKLIANDAMKLSILITDNLGLDSNYTAMYKFAIADLLLQQHKYDDAFYLYDSIQAEFPDHGLADEILMRKAQAMQEQGKWNEAISYLEKIVKYYFDDILADDAVFQLGDIYENHLKDKEKAAEYYKKILFECKGSLLTVEARKRFRALRGDAAISEDDL
jgi:tetratricopeptide (TPR) repeat protein